MVAPEMPQIDPHELACEHDELWFLAYDGTMHSAVLAKRLGGEEPLDRRTVRVENAWLSWDFRGIPYVEPCYPSLIIRGFNDSSAPKTAKAYRAWLWARAAPGIPDAGTEVPCLEGVAYKITQKQYLRLGQTEGAKPVELPRCQVFVNGESDTPLVTISCMSLVAKDNARGPPGMQPSQDMLRTVATASFTSVLSQTYLSHLNFIRPYAGLSALPPRLRLGAALFRLCLAAPYLCLVFPLAVAKPRLLGCGGWEPKALGWVVWAVWAWAGWAERWVWGPAFGSGYQTDRA